MGFKGWWSTALVWMCLFASGAAAGSQPAKISGRWLGQVGKDMVGPSPRVAPNGIQDICIVLTNLPRGHAITSAKINGEGGSEWRFKGDGHSFAAAVVREKNGPRAELLMEPDRAETGRAFFIHLEFDDGTSSNVTVVGGRADPRLRVPGAEIKAVFLGNTGEDLTGASAAVGPDGRQDAVVEFSALPTDVAVTSMRIQSGKDIWETGLNPKAYMNAEFVIDPKDSTRGKLYLQPPQAMRGAVTIEINYANNGRDEVRVAAAKHASARPVAAAPRVALTPNRFSVKWVGQLEQAAADASGDRGDIHLAVGGLPQKKLMAAGLSDAAGGYWAWRADDRVPFEISQWDRNLKVIQDSRGGRLALFFPPYRDEKGASMGLWLLFEGGEMTFTPFDGQTVDPYLYGQAPDPSRVIAKPGDDLQALVKRYGNVELIAGVYPLNAPLVLDEPVDISGPREAILEFSQKDGSTWTTTVNIHRSNTTLRGFTIRFATPVTWRRDGNPVPTVVGSSEAGDGGVPDAKRNITIAGMRIDAPPSSDPSKWEECPNVIRMGTATSGRIEGNELRGGMTQLIHGPWVVKGNTYLGCPPGFWAWDTFTTRWTHDLIVEDNHLRPPAGSGKTWRFLVLAGYGFNNIVRNNTVENIGIRDSDTLANPNAAEILLTEAYSVKFEGRPAAIREGGRLLMLPLLQGDAPRSGDGVAILTGKHAGEWFGVSQAISPTTVLMDKPLPTGDYDISIATGFTNLLIEGNTIDSTGGGAAGNLILAGNHFGTTVRNNHLIGGGAFMLMSCPSEHPNIWGWTHCPYVGGVIEGNILENSNAATMGMQYSKAMKTTAGRTYFSALFRDNVFRYTAAGLSRREFARHEGQIIAMTIDEPGGLDAAGSAVRLENTTMQMPADREQEGVIHVNTATINGKEVKDGWVVIPKQAMREK